MMDILKYLMENSDERFTKQIQYIMDQLTSDISKEKSEILSKSQTLSESNDEDNDVDDLDEDDDLVEEEELEESIHLEQSFPLGEDLLVKYFLLPSEQAFKQSNLIKSIVKQQQKSLNVSRINEKKFIENSENMFKRPTTPSLSINASIIVEQSRDIPSEMKARPKILRTPAEGENKANQSQNNELELSKEEKKENIGKSMVLNMESPFMNEKKIELRVFSYFIF